MKESYAKRLIKNNICIIPFVRLGIRVNGNVQPCCPGHMKIPVTAGNILINNLDQIWNSGAIQLLRDAVYEKKYHKFCDKDCPAQSIYLEIDKYTPLVDEELYSQILEKRTRLSTPYSAISINTDNSCNLACIMCRDKRIIAPSTKTEEITQRAFQEVLSNIKKIKWLRLGAGGEFFFQNKATKFLEKLQTKGLSHLVLSIITNGTLLNNNNLGLLESMNVKKLTINISIDAAKKNTYEKIRRFASWDQLTKNLKILAIKREENKLDRLLLNFVVMKSNVHEMCQFVELAKEWNCDEVNFWKIYDNKISQPENFFIKKDPYYLQILSDCLNNPIMGSTHPKVNINHLQAYKKPSTLSVGG